MREVRVRTVQGGLPSITPPTCRIHSLDRLAWSSRPYRPTSFCFGVHKFFSLNSSHLSIFGYGTRYLDTIALGHIALTPLYPSHLSQRDSTSTCHAHARVYIPGVTCHETPWCHMVIFIFSPFPLTRTCQCYNLRNNQSFVYLNGLKTHNKMVQFCLSFRVLAVTVSFSSSRSLSPSSPCLTETYIEPSCRGVHPLAARTLIYFPF